jgi:hypothetical protein
VIAIALLAAGEAAADRVRSRAAAQPGSADRMAAVRAARTRPDWVNRVRQRARTAVSRGIAPKGARRGAVIAATSGNSEYQFHWTRDAAIVMNEVAVGVATFARRGVAGLKIDRLVRRLEDYVAYSRYTQRLPAAGGVSEP